MENYIWEYKIILVSKLDHQKLEDQLQQAGKEGWEAVGITSYAYGWNSVGANSSTSTRVLLKRCVPK